MALFYALEPPEFQHWLGVERVMQEEARQQAEQILQALAAEVQAKTGKMPVLYLRDGRRRDQLLALIGEEPGISLLVLGMASGREGPGPLVTYLDDVTSAMTRAKEAAGDRNVLVHGAGVARLALGAGVLDELELHVIPVLFGQGRRLFDGLAAEQIELERTRILEGEDGVVHMRYRVKR